MELNSILKVMVLTQKIWSDDVLSILKRLAILKSAYYYIVQKIGQKIG